MFCLFMIPKLAINKADIPSSLHGYTCPCISDDRTEPSAEGSKVLDPSESSSGAGVKPLVSMARFSHVQYIGK